MFADNTRILIVDDMVAMRRMVKSQIKTLGFTDYLEAENGRRAYEILCAAVASGNPIQLVLADWNMPGMTGLDLLSLIRTTKGMEQLPFLMITAESQRDQILEAIKAGVSNYLLKPFSPDGMKQKIEAVWQKHHGSK